MRSHDSTKNRKMRFWLKKVLWRHVVGIIVAAFALFPLVWMISAAFDITGQISTQQLIPVHKGLDNFVQLFNNKEKPFDIWSKNSLIIAGSVAVLSVMIGTASAFAFSRL